MICCHQKFLEKSRNISRNFSEDLDKLSILSRLYVIGDLIGGWSNSLIELSNCGEDLRQIIGASSYCRIVSITIAGEATYISLAEKVARGALIGHIDSLWSWRGSL